MLTYYGIFSRYKIKFSGIFLNNQRFLVFTIEKYIKFQLKTMPPNTKKI